MSLKNIQYKFLLFTALLSLLTLAACTDDMLDINDGQGIPDAEGTAIGFVISLQAQDPGARGRSIDASFEEYENYIDTKDKLRVLFFDKDNKFMFGAIDRSVTPLGSDGTMYNWYVRVPLNYIVDRDGKLFDVDIIKKKLRTEEFKIAVLANWPNAGYKVVGGESDSDDDVTTAPTVSELKGEPNWGWEHSVLNKDAKPDSIKTLNDLHHLEYDATYANNPTAYNFLAPDLKLGVTTGWVKMIHPVLDQQPGASTQDKANYWIRNNVNPLSGHENVSDYFYQKLWQHWDFSGYSNFPQSDYGEGGKFINQWMTRNGNNLLTWFNLNYQNNWPLQSFNNYDGLKFVTISNAGTIYTYDGKGYWGVVLPVVGDYNNHDENWKSNPNSRDKSRDYVDDNNPLYNPKGYFKFIAPATGTLKILWSSSGSHRARLFVQKSKNNETRPATDYGTSIQTLSRKVSITGDSEPIYIWFQEGPGVIYGIEWICDKYLYDTDRIGIAPSEENPIPMYGVQEYLPLKDWEEGSTLNLSGDKSISLIRSLAKVEVFLPIISGQPSHVMMRSMNRSSRCEPVDVETPTNTLWKNHDNISSEQCEWFDIQNYGPNFDETITGESTPSNQFKNYLSWFFGTWKGKAKTNFSGISVPTTYSYPHLFNPHVNRSDFCNLLYAGVVGNYYKYVIYMPDKAIDDPNSVGLRNAIPKVPHIEYRIEADQHTENLDDNKCYRLYFTDYSNPNNPYINSSLSETGDYETVLEKKKANLKYLWPIVRNHVYQFYVKDRWSGGGSGPKNINVQLDVKDWSYEKVIVDW